MNALISKRIGIVELNAQAWIGGQHFMRMLARVLADACGNVGAELFVLSDRATNGDRQRGLRADGIRTVTIPRRHHCRSERLLRGLLHLPDKSELLDTAHANDIDVLLPLLSIPDGATGLKTIGWIPDFQHVHLPGYFSEADRQDRDTGFELLAKRATLVMLTSQDVREDFAAFAPTHAHKARVMPFPAFIATEPLTGNPAETVRKFNLPEKFVLVANQFWRHKNHQVVVEAVARLRQRGLRIPVVMIGLPADYRDPVNQTLSQTLQSIACADVADQVYVLGFVSDTEALDLMRSAAVVVQPSRFEGWSTVVQNTKALGRPLICSEIAAHREQAPNSLGFFPCDSAEALADILDTHWLRLTPGPDPKVERQAFAAERKLIGRYGQSILNLCLEACSG